MTTKPTQHQRTLIENYLNSTDGTQAAIHAGCDPETAKQDAAEMMKDPDVREYLIQALHEKYEREEQEQIEGSDIETAQPGNVH